MKYQIVIEFETDRFLTPEECDAILFACRVQVDEPVDFEQNDIDVRTSISKIAINRMVG